MPELQEQPKLHRRFDLSMPRQALLALGVIVAHNHLHAKEKASISHGVVGVSRCGLLRWIDIDSDVIRIMHNSFTGVTAELVDTPANGGKHVEVACPGFRILLVHDLDRDADVPVSDYGRDLAKTNNAPLFISNEEWESQNPQSDEPYTAVLFHSKQTPESLPNVIAIRFPGEHGDQTIPINLYDRFPELLIHDEVNRLYAQINARVVTAPAVVEDLSHPSVRKQHKKEA